MREKESWPVSHAFPSGLSDAAAECIVSSLVLHRGRSFHDASALTMDVVIVLAGRSVSVAGSEGGSCTLVVALCQAPPQATRILHDMIAMLPFGKGSGEEGGALIKAAVRVVSACRPGSFLK